MLKQLIEEKIAEILLGGDLGHKPNTEEHDNPSGMKGQYVIVRTRNAGVLAGILEEHGDRFIKLTNSRRLKYHNPGKGNPAWYEGVAKGFLHSSSQVAPVTPIAFMNEEYQIISCTPEGRKAIEEAPEHEAIQDN